MSDPCWYCKRELPARGIILITHESRFNGDPDRTRATCSARCAHMAVTRTGLHLERLDDEHRSVR